jgi:uncharacterized membrane protein
VRARHFGNLIPRRTFRRRGCCGGFPIVVARSEPANPSAIGPVTAVLLAGAGPLFLGGLLSDLAYAATAEVQWSNFAAWLIAGGMVFAGLALLLTFIALLRTRPWRPWLVICFVMLLAAFVLGFIDSFVHARDAWAVMPAAPMLSAIVAGLTLVAIWSGFSSLRAGDGR